MPELKLEKFEKSINFWSRQVTKKFPQIEREEAENEILLYVLNKKENYHSEGKTIRGKEVSSFSTYINNLINWGALELMKKERRRNHYEQELKINLVLKDNKWDLDSSNISLNPYYLGKILFKEAQEKIMQMDTIYKDIFELYFIEKVGRKNIQRKLQIKYKELDRRLRELGWIVRDYINY